MNLTLVLLASWGLRCCVRAPPHHSTDTKQITVLLSMVVPSLVWPVTPGLDATTLGSPGLLEGTQRSSADCNPLPPPPPAECSLQAHCPRVPAALLVSPGGSSDCGTAGPLSWPGLVTGSPYSSSPAASQAPLGTAGKGGHSLMCPSAQTCAGLLITGAPVSPSTRQAWRTCAHPQ